MLSFLFNGNKYAWVVACVALLSINLLVSFLPIRLDLTKEKRYTLSPATDSLLATLDEPISIDVFLQGEFPAGFQKLSKSTAEFLQLLKSKNSSKVNFRFISPKETMPGNEQMKYGDSLVALGVSPINLTVQLQEGQQQNYIFPVATMHYKGKQQLINLYAGSNRLISQNEINEADALLEYQFLNAIQKISTTEKQNIAYATGNGEPENEKTYDLQTLLKDEYNLFQFNISTQPIIPSEIKALLVVKPTIPFTDAQLLKLDQFVMRGGKLICFIDNLIAEQDSLSKRQTIAFARNLNLTELFFKWGARINADLIMDLQCESIPFVVGEGADNKPQFEFLHWNYYPLFQSYNTHSINRNIGLVGSRFANSMDTIQAPGIKKTVLLSSSSASRRISTPAIISLEENRNVPEDEKFKSSQIPTALLLEGEFTSLFKNRISSSQADSLQYYKTPFVRQSAANKIIIVGDGDIALNEFLPEAGPLPMGWNKYSYLAYEQGSKDARYFIPVANRQFVQNCLEYLVSSAAIIETRNKNIVLRLLDTKKVKAEKTKWQWINIALPIIILLLFGWIFQQLRKKKFA